MKSSAAPTHDTTVELPTLLDNLLRRLGLTGTLLVRKKRGTKASARDLRDLQTGLSHIFDAPAAVADLLDLLHPSGDPDHESGATEIAEACNILARHGFGPLATPSRKIKGRPKRRK